MARQLAPLFFFGPVDGDFLLIGGRETAHGRRDEIQLVRVDRHADNARERIVIKMRQERLKRVEIAVFGHAQRDFFEIDGGKAVEVAEQEVKLILLDGHFEYAGARVVRQIEEHAGQLVEIAVFSQRKRDARPLLGGQLSAMLDQLVAAAAAERRVDHGVLRVGREPFPREKLENVVDIAVFSAQTRDLIERLLIERERRDEIEVSVFGGGQRRVALFGGSHVGDVILNVAPLAVIDRVADAAGRVVVIVVMIVVDRDMKATGREFFAQRGHGAAREVGRELEQIVQREIVQLGGQLGQLFTREERRKRGHSGDGRRLGECPVGQRVHSRAMDEWREGGERVQVDMIGAVLFDEGGERVTAGEGGESGESASVDLRGIETIQQTVDRAFAHERREGGERGKVDVISADFLGKAFQRVVAGEGGDAGERVRVDLRGIETLQQIVHRGVVEERGDGEKQ